MIRWAFYSTLATGLFYGLYCLLLKRDHWLQISRWYLLISLTFSLIFPLLRLPVGFTEKSAEPSVWISTGIPTMSVVETGGSGETVNIGLTIYLLGLFFMAVLLSVQTWSLVSNLRKLSYKKRGNIRLATPDDGTQPFSFFNRVVIGTKGLSAEELECIISHEQLHARQHHSVDILYMRTLCCIAWFNPLAWIMLRELRTVHEYLADGEVIHSHGRKGYLGLLYREAVGIGYSYITNNFQSTNIKKRIMMMKQERSRYGAWKLLAALPVAALLLMVGSQPAAAQSAGTKTKASTEKTSTQTATTQRDAATTTGTQSVKTGPDVEPQFPGGVEALYQYLAANIKYPEKARSEGIQGTVYVRFTIDTDGAIYNVEVSRGIGGGCDEEAARVVKAMPKWSPTIDNGKPVAVSYVLPISFKL